MSILSKILDSMKRKRSEPPAPEPAFDRNALLLRVANASLNPVYLHMPMETRQRCMDVLNNMETNISELGDVQPMPELCDLLVLAAERCLPQVYRYGSEDQVQRLKFALRRGVGALRDNQLTQQCAVVILQTALLMGAVCEGDHWIEKLSHGLEDLRGARFKPYNPWTFNCALQVETLRTYNKTAESIITNLEDRLREMQLGGSAEDVDILPFLAEMEAAFQEIRQEQQEEDGVIIDREYAPGYPHPADPQDEG